MAIKKIDGKTADANLIATILKNTVTEEWGDLLMLVSNKLERNTQFYTANIIKAAAKQYGISKKERL